MRLARLSIRITDHAHNPMAVGPSAQINRVTLLFAIQHDCTAATSYDPSAPLTKWGVVHNMHLPLSHPDIGSFTWPGPPLGPVHNVTRATLKAAVASETVVAPGETFVRLTIPELTVQDWPLAFEGNKLGTYYPYALLHDGGSAFCIDYSPAMLTLDRLTVQVRQGSGEALLQDGEGCYIFLLFELQQVHLYPAAVPRAPSSKLLLVDYRQLDRASSFRHTLQDPIRGISTLKLCHMSLPHSADGASHVRVRVVDSVGSLWYLDVQLHTYDAVTAAYVPFKSLPQGKPFLCMCLEASM